MASPAPQNYTARRQFIAANFRNVRSFLFSEQGRYHQVFRVQMNVNDSKYHTIIWIVDILPETSEQGTI